MKLMTVIETTRDSSLLRRIIRWMGEKPLADVVNEPEVRTTFEGLYDNHLKSIEMMRERATFTDGVIEYDISEKNIEGQNKFIPYYVFPEAVYSVGVSLSPVRAKVSVGSNPVESAGANRESCEVVRAIRGRRTRCRCRNLIQARCSADRTGGGARDCSEAPGLS
jgi:hypothetical protein